MTSRSRVSGPAFSSGCSYRLILSRWRSRPVSGGATSSTSTGQGSAGINTSLAGLVLQVFTLLVFVVLVVDYSNRYHGRHEFNLPARARFTHAFGVFLTFLGIAVVLIFTRCVYRIAELSQGYSGSVFYNEGLFIALKARAWTLPCALLAHFLTTLFDVGEHLAAASIPDPHMLTAAPLLCRFIAAAAFSLNVAHPGVAFPREEPAGKEVGDSPEVGV